MKEFEEMIVKVNYCIYSRWIINAVPVSSWWLVYNALHSSLSFSFRSLTTAFALSKFRSMKS